jgi:hypothetical protein
MPPAQDSWEASLSLYPYGMSRHLVEQTIGHLHLPIQIVGGVERADAILTLKAHLRKQANLKQMAEGHRVPIYAVKANTFDHIALSLQQALGRNDKGGGFSRALGELAYSGNEAESEAVEEARWGFFDCFAPLLVAVLPSAKSLALFLSPMATGLPSRSVRCSRRWQGLRGRTWAEPEALKNLWAKLAATITARQHAALTDAKASSPKERKPMHLIQCEVLIASNFKSIDRWQELSPAFCEAIAHLAVGQTYGAKDREFVALPPGLTSAAAIANSQLTTFASTQQAEAYLRQWSALSPESQQLFSKTGLGVSPGNTMLIQGRFYRFKTIKADIKGGI